MAKYKRRKKIISRKKLLQKSFYSKKRSRADKISSGSTKFFHRSLSCILLIIFIAIFYFVFYSTYFDIKNVVLIDNKKITAGQVEQIYDGVAEDRRWILFSGKNIIVFNSPRLEYDLLEEIPMVEKVATEKKYPNILKIKIKEVEPVAIWMTGSKTYYINSEGLVGYEIFNASEEKNTLPLVKDNSGREIAPREKVTSEAIMSFIKTIADDLNERTGLAYDSFVLPSGAAEEVHLKTDQGYNVYFSLHRDALSQLNDLAMVIDSEVKGKEVDYIDLRIENWVYYK